MHPNLFHLGHITLPTFGALAALGLMLALAFSQRTARVVGLNPDQLWDAGLFAVLAAFLFSRLLLVATYLQAFRNFPILLLAVPSLTPAGLLLTAIATFLWLYFKRIPVLPALDAWAPCATLVWAFLALGHFAEGSDPGLRIPSVAPYVAVVALMLTGAAYANLKRRHIAALTLIAAGAAQFLLSFLRQPGMDSIAGLDALQVVALGMIVAGCMLVLIPGSPARLRSNPPQ